MDALPPTCRNWGRKLSKGDPKWPFDQTLSKERQREAKRRWQTARSRLSIAQFKRLLINSNQGSTNHRVSSTAGDRKIRFIRHSAIAHCILGRQGSTGLLNGKPQLPRHSATNELCWRSIEKALARKNQSYLGYYLWLSVACLATPYY